MRDARSKTMWRQLKKRAHPDHGGTDELFAWVTELEAHVEDLENRPPQVLAPMFGPGGVSAHPVRPGSFRPRRAG